jgi:hypothetical protein
MKAILVFAIAISSGFWAADQLCFDGDYSAKIFKRGNELGAVWQNETRHWFGQHGFQTARH